MRQIKVFMHGSKGSALFSHWVQFIYLAALYVIFGCGPDHVQDVAGTSSETVIGQVLLPNGGPAVGMQYRLRDIRFLADPSSRGLTKISTVARGQSGTRDGVTDRNGGFSIDSVAPGEYQLEIGDRSDLGLLLPISVRAASGENLTGKHTLQATGTLLGTVDPANAFLQDSTFLHGYVQVYGMDRVASVNGVTGGFRFQSLPPGRVRIRVYSPVPFIQFTELDGIEILPGGSKNIDSVVLVRTSTANFTSLVPDGLISYWPFDEGAGNQTVDPVGGLDGRLEGLPTWSKGKVGGAMSFDGIDAYIAIPTLYLYSDFSISAWVRLRGPIDNSQVLAGMDDSCNLNFAQKQFRLYSGALPLTVDTLGKPSWDEVIGKTVQVPDVWSHVAITRKNGDLQVYQNGNLDGTGTWNGVFLFNRIGRGFRLTAGIRSITHLHGDIDEFRVYNRALTLAEVSALSSAP